MYIYLFMICVCQLHVHRHLVFALIEFAADNFQLYLG